jgi:hypothetical protein
MIKKLILIAVSSMFIVSYPVMADWDFYDSSADQSIDIYIDSSRIKSSGDVVKVWALANYKVAQKYGSSQKFLSAVSLVEFQCAEEVTRDAHTTAYTEKMGGGAVIFSKTSRITRWDPILPSSIDEGIMYLVCGKDQK